ncbi:MAG: hypothetical protein LQ352_005567 [Teloschistes flavicans]|nr:MAG: hypothetical protein LQ352_005567 [Teloschistes flavicans]
MVDPVGTAASIITIISLSCTIAVNVKQLVQNIKQQNERAKELEDKLDSLTDILGQTASLYQGKRSDTASEQQLQQTVYKVVQRCREDLRRVEEILKDITKHGNWASVTWKRQIAAPKLENIEKSLSDRQGQLTILVLLLQRPRMDQIQEVHEMVQQVHGMLRILTNRTITDRPFNGISEGQLPDTDLIILKTTTAIMDSEPAGDEEEEPDHTGTAKVSDSEDSSGSNANGQALLKAIEERNFDSFQSLLQNPETSVKIQDDKERTPLLLAAHLDAPEEDASPSSSPRNSGEQEATSIPIHRDLDLDAADSLGRTPLHYCAEFKFLDAANHLLDHGVDVDRRDTGGYPPIYYAVKKRNADAAKLLVDKGASTEFERPDTSAEINTLLDKDTRNDL